MREVRLDEFGPFGDEDDLQALTDTIDFVRSGVRWGQVIRRYSQRGRPDSTGAWFDRRATFLLRNHRHRSRIAFEPGKGGSPPHPVEFNGEAGDLLAPRAGRHLIEGELPQSVRQSEFFYAGPRADKRFLLYPGDSPRTHVCGAMRIRSVRLKQ